MKPRMATEEIMSKLKGIWCKRKSIFLTLKVSKIGAKSGDVITNDGKEILEVGRYGYIT